MTHITVKAGSYNDFCYKLRNLFVDVETVKVAGPRSKFYDHFGNLVATYDERKDHGIVNNYDTHSPLVGQILKF